MEGEASGADEILPAIWDKLSRARSPWLGGTFRLGASDRLPSDRLRRLLRTSVGKAVLAATTGLDAAALEQIETIAKINAEQAEAAFRRTFVFNITAPIAVFAAAIQAMPQNIEENLDTLSPRSLAFYLIWGSALGIVASVYYAHVKARGARDLADAVALVRASRHRAPNSR